MVRLEGVGLDYGTGPSKSAVLQDLSFEVEEGGFRWLLGPSGAGKTSLLKLLNLSPATHFVAWFGAPLELPDPVPLLAAYGAVALAALLAVRRRVRAVTALVEAKKAGLGA